MRSSSLKNYAVDLHWLAYLLTGRRTQSIDLAADAATRAGGANPYFDTWMLAWSRRVVIAKALAAIREKLAASARRTEQRRERNAICTGGKWILDPRADKAALERSLLAIDDFPRAVLLLTIFEGVAAEDAAVLLDSSPRLVAKARNLGLMELTGNLRHRPRFPGASAGMPALAGTQSPKPGFQLS